MTTPFNYQLQCIEEFKKHTHYSNLSDLGTGKTLVTLLAYDYHHHINNHLKLVVVCPKTLKREWINEIKKHLGNKFKWQVLVTGKSKLDSKAHIYILNYDILKPRKEKGKKRKSKYTDVVNRIIEILPKAMLAGDEIQRCGHYSSWRTKVMMDLARIAQKVYFMTGTPMLNKPETLFPILYTLKDSDYSCWTPYMANTKFIEDYCVRDYTAYGRVVGYKNLDRLKKKLDKVSIRFRKEDALDLPELMHNTYYAELSGDQLKHYNNMRDELVTYINTLSQEKIAKEATNILVQMLRLLQICSMPKLLGHYTTQLPAKIAVLDELIEEHIEDKKIIISTVFREMNDYIRDRYSDYKPVQLMGGLSEAQRAKAIEDFQNGDSRILVIHPAVGGIGLNLTCSNMMIFYDRNFSLTEWLQAQGRIHRIGQTKECYIVKIVAENTIDEKIDEVIRVKEVLANKVLTNSVEIQSFKSTVLNLLSEGDTMKFDFGAATPAITATPAAAPAFSLFSGATPAPVDNRMDQLNAQLKEQAGAALSNLSVNNVSTTIDDIDAQLLKGLLNKEMPIPFISKQPVNFAGEKMLPLDLVPIPTTNAAVPCVDSKAIEFRFQQIEHNLGNMILGENNSTREYLVKQMMPGMVKMAEKIIELEVKIDHLNADLCQAMHQLGRELANDVRTGVEAVAPKRTRTRKAADITVDGPMVVAPVTDHQKSIIKAAEIVSSVLVTNGLDAPWNVTVEQMCIWVRQILAHKEISCDDTTVKQIAEVLCNDPQ